MHIAHGAALARRRGALGRGASGVNDTAASVDPQNARLPRRAEPWQLVEREGGTGLLGAAFAGHELVVARLAC
jgi:hypothetical protein